MEEKNNMQENGSVFGNMNNPDTASEKDLYKGLDSDTFGKVENETGEQDATVYTSPWNSDAYIPGGQTDYYSTQPPVSEKKQSKALEICALVFGILSLCGCCYGLFGLIGLVLSIIALAKGKKSGLSIAGLILSIIGIVGALVWTIFCFSSAGQEWSSNIAESFMEGFEEGYNATYDNSSTEVESDVDIETESNATENTSLKNEVVGKVTIDGKEITIPCKFSEMKSEFEFSEMSKEDLVGGLEAYDLKIISLASNGKSTGVSLVVSNNSDTDIADINDAYITGVSVDSFGEVPQEVKFFKDITVTMSKKDLETALKGIEYEEDASDDYSYYSFYLGENSDFSFSIYVTDDEVSDITYSYYGDCE